MQNTFKITIKQAYALFLLASFSPLIRLTSGAGARIGGSAAWVSIIISAAVYYGLIILFSLYFKQNANKNADLYSAYKSAFGKVIAKILVLVYALWVFTLAAFYLRAFAERFAGAIMPGVSAGFFAVTVLALVFVILSGRLRSFAILSEIFFYVILCVIAVVFLLQVSKIRAENLLPVTVYNAKGIINGTLPTMGIFAYITPLMFLFCEVQNGENEKKMGNFRKYGLYSGITLLCVSLVIFAVTVGVFGSGMTALLSQPFLTSVKSISILGSLDRLESVFLLLWVVTDLALIVMLMYVLIRLVNIFFGFSQNADADNSGFDNSEKYTPIKTPLLCGVYIFSLCLMRGAGETQWLSEKIILPLNVALGVAVPVLAILLWKLREKCAK